MNFMIKATVCVLVSVVLCNTIPKERKELSILLSITACVLVSIAALSNLQPVLLFIERFRSLAKLNTEIFKILIEVAGVSMITDVSCLICQDFGSGALGKSLQFMATSTILLLSIPIFEELLLLVEEILGMI